MFSQVSVSRGGDGYPRSLVPGNWFQVLSGKREKRVPHSGLSTWVPHPLPSPFSQPGPGQDYPSPTGHAMARIQCESYASYVFTQGKFLVSHYFQNGVDIFEGTDGNGGGVQLVTRKPDSTMKKK